MDAAIDQPVTEKLEEGGPLGSAEDRRGGHVEEEFDAAVGGVHALTAGAGAPAEPLDQLGGGDDQALWQARTSPDHEISSWFHAPIVA